MKKFLKENRFYIIFGCCFFLVSLLFPYTGDDWYWGTYDLDFNLFSIFSQDLELNGRYLGNLMAVVLTRNIFVRGLIMSIIISLLFKLIHTYTKADNRLILLLFLVMPIEIFKQVVPWSAGFANYMISALLFLTVLYILNNKNGKKRNCVIFFLSIITSLFLENITLFLLGLTLILNVRFFVKNKRVNYLYLCAFVGSVIGTLIMFLQPSYILSFTGENPYRVVASEGNDILYLIKYNYFNDFIKYGVNANYISFAVLEIMIFYYYFKNMEKYGNKLLLLFGITYLLLMYMMLSMSIQVLYDAIYLSGIIGTIYLICIIYLLFKLFKDNKEMNYIWGLIAIMVGVVGPLLIVSPIGARNFLIINLLLNILILKVYSQLYSKMNKYISIGLYIIIGVLSLTYINVYYNVNKVYIIRDNYIENNKCKLVLDVPRLPYHKYVWWPDFEEDKGDYYPNYYKKYKNLPDRIRFKFYDYDEWTNRKIDVSTCS